MLSKLYQRFERIRFLGHKYTVFVTANYLVSVAWLALSLLYYHPISTDNRSGYLVGIVGLCIVSILWLKHHYNSWVKVIVHPVTAFVVQGIVLAMALLLFLQIGITSSELHAYITEQGLSPEQWPQYFKYNALFQIAIPLFISQAIPYFYYQKVKYFSLWRFLRQLRKGHGGHMSFAGLGNYYDKGIRYRLFSGKRTIQVLLGSTTYEYDPYTRLIGDDSNSNILSFGCIGSGKSTTAIYPVLSTYAGSIICLDPKGEICRTTIGRRSQSTLRYKGETFCLDPFDVNEGMNIESHCYNPLAEIDPLSDDPALIHAITEACVIQEPSEKHQHFIDMGRSLIAGIIAHVLSVYPKDCHTLPYVFDLFNGVDPELKTADPDRFEQLLKDMRFNPAFGGLAQQASKDLKDVGDKEKGSILSTTARSMKWIGDPKMRRHLSGHSDFSFTQIGINKRSTTVYIILPLSKMEHQKRWFRLLSSVGIALMRDRKKTPNIPTLFILDEFPQLQYMDVVKKAYATLRSSGIRIWCFCQNFSQLKALYGEEAYTFIGNSTKQFFGIADIETAKLISSSIGTSVVRGKARELLTPAEIMSDLSKESNRQIILSSKETRGRDNLPYWLERLTYLRYRKDFRAYPNHRKYYPRYYPLIKKAKSWLYVKSSFFFSTASAFIRQYRALKRHP